MKNKYNNLTKYIYEYSDKALRKETINSLFRAVLAPIIQNPEIESCILIRVFDKEEKESVLRRLSFSKAKIFGYTDINSEENIVNCEKENIWNSTEFLVVLAGRYSVALIWDYSESGTENNTRTCLLYNSKIITEIAKIIAENSKEDIKELVKEYVPDRRENILLNKSIHEIINILDNINEEIIISEKEKKSLEKDENILKTAKIIEDRAKFVAHEIKNHLSVINLYSKIAEKRFDSVKGEEGILESIKNSIKNIKNASENISYLISNLRCMSTAYKTNINIKDIIENVIDLCKVKAENFEAEININKIKDAIILTDKTRIECAMTNIIFNALDANAKNIIIEASEDKIIIKNDGEKIPEKNFSKIFQENFTTKNNGSGLGLAFCKEQLKQIGGDINLINSNETETSFEISL